MSDEQPKDARGNPPSTVSAEELQRLLAQQQFATFAEAEAFIAKYMQQTNEMPIADFQGLTASQMKCLLNAPFDSPEVVTFPEAPPTAIDAPMMRMFALMLDGIGEKGVKLTAKGNLPRNLVREIVAAIPRDPWHGYSFEPQDVRSEEEYGELMATRIAAVTSGLLRKYHGKILATRKCTTLIARNGLPGVYQLLLKTLATKFNWAYYNQYLDIPFIQQSVLYTAFLLQRFGGQWRKVEFYQDAYLQAFPRLVEAIVPGAYSTAEQVVRQLYVINTLSFFTRLAGWAEMRDLGTNWLNREEEIRKTPLLDEVVRFTL